MRYCSLQHWTLLPSLVTSTTGCCFCFGSVSSFFMELFLHCSPVAYWPTTYLPGDFIFQCPIFCFFILFMGFSKQLTASNENLTTFNFHTITYYFILNLFLYLSFIYKVVFLHHYHKWEQFHFFLICLSKNVEKYGRNQHIVKQFSFN